MPIDRHALEKAASAANDRIRDRAPTGVAGMLAGLHKGVLASFVTVESVPLPPVPVVRDGRWQVLALLAIPAGPGKGLQAPWGAVWWNADGTVAETRRFDAPANTGAYTVDRAGWSRLLGALDRVIAGPADADLAAIAGLYDGVMPAGVRPVVHGVAPGTRAWLG